MATLPESELRAVVLKFAEEIRTHDDKIRVLQQEMLKEVPLEQWGTATSALDGILARTKVIHMTENYFQNVGVANTGDMSKSTVTGSNHQVNLGESAQALLDAFAKFKQQVQADVSLTPEQKEDAVSAASQIEAEIKKPEGFWSMSTVRNSANALKTLATSAQALNTMYSVVHPILAAHFHLPV